MQYDESLYQSLKTYYSILSNVGYYNEDTDNLIIYIFLNNYIDVFNDTGLITEEDIKTINKATRCLQSCVLNIPYLNALDLFTNNKIWQIKDVLEYNTKNTLNLTELDKLKHLETDSNSMNFKAIE